MSIAIERSELAGKPGLVPLSARFRAGIGWLAGRIRAFWNRCNAEFAAYLAESTSRERNEPPDRAWLR